MKVTMELTEEQYQLIVDSLEANFRLRMFQALNISAILAFDGYEYKDGTQAELGKRVQYRESMEATLLSVEFMKREIQPYKSKETNRLIDIWRVFRHEHYTLSHDGTDYMDVRSDKPFQESDLPLPEVSIALEG